MKRLSFKPIALFTAMVSIPAAAQATEQKSDFELLADSSVAHAQVPVRIRDAANLGLTFKFDGDKLRLDGRPDVPAVCVQQLHVQLEYKIVGDAKEKLRHADSIENDELTNFTTEIVPVISFNGIPQIKSFSECVSRGKELEKADFDGDHELGIDINSPSEPAFVNWNGKIVSNEAFDKLAAYVKRVNCKENCNGTPEQVLETLSSEQRELVAGLSSKLAEDAQFEFLRKMVEGIDAAQSLDNLSAIRKDLSQFLKDLNRSPLSDSLTESMKGDLRQKVDVIRTEAIVAKAKELCRKSMTSGPLEAGAASTSTWAKSSWLFAKKPSGDDIADTYLKFIAQTMKEASDNPGIPADSKELYRERAKQLTKKHSDLRVLTLVEMGVTDGQEINQAKQTSLIDMQRNQQYLVTQCGANPQNPLEYNVMNRRFMSYQQMAYAQTQCDTAAKTFAQSGMRLNVLGMQLSPTVNPDMTGYNGFRAGYSQASPQLNPFQLSPNYFPTSNQWNSSGNYQGFNADQYFRLNQPQPTAADPREVNNTQLPYAIPLRMQPT